MTASPDEPHIGLIVEGAGDAASVPVLLRRWLHGHGDFRDLLGKPVAAQGTGRVLRRGGIEGLTAAVASRPGCLSVLIVIDGEGGPVCTLGPALLSRATSVTQKPVEVALADSEFESWLVASAETLDLPSLAFDAAADPTTLIRSALNQDRNEKYTKPVWQPRLAARIDLELAAGRSRSFARLLDRFEQLRNLVA